MGTTVKFKKGQEDEVFMAIKAKFESAPTDCFLYSSDGYRFKVHKVSSDARVA